MFMMVSWILLYAAGLIKASSIPAMFFFGASMLDIGTNNYIPNCTVRADMPPFGETFFHHPTGRFSDGLILSDFLEILVALPFIPPYLQPGADFSRGANFASAGSGLFPTDELNLILWDTQIEQFVSLVNHDNSPNKLEKLSKSLFVINAGTNDLLRSMFPTQILVNKFKHGLQEMYKAGARKFLIVGIGPLSYAPRVQSTYKKGSLEFLDKSVLSYNLGLRNITREFDQQLHDVDVVYFNTYDFFMDMIKNSSKYGFVNTEDCCCGSGPRNALIDCGKQVPKYKPFLCEDPSKYLYWNLHPTQKAYHYMAQAIWNGDSSLIWPINLQTLLDKRVF